jgi:hypothetical protein
MDTNDFERTCANCACFAEAPTPPGTPPRYMCRLEPVKLMQQVRQGQLMTTGRGDPGATVEVGLAYGPTLPNLVCFGHWRPQGMPPGEDMQSNPTIARMLIDALRAGRSS